MTQLARLILVFIAAVQSTQAAERAAPDLAHAEALLRSGQAAGAWRVLEPHEPRLAGNQEYDYLLGLAALESGQSSRASFILERVVGINPDHAAARLDLGRALYAAGDLERAKLEFEAVRKYNPPEMAEQAIRQYLAAIEQQANAGKSRRTGYAEVGFGSDSNVNAGVSNGEYFMPILSTTLSSKAKRTSYGSVAAGAELVLVDTPDREYFGGVDIRRRHHQHLSVDSTRTTDYYDTRSVEGRIGVQQKLDQRNTLRFTASLARQTLDDNQPYRRTQSLLAEWRHAFAAGAQGSLWLMEQRNRFGTVDATDFRQYGGNQLLVGLGAVKGFGADNTFVTHLSLYGGQERATDIAQGNLDGDKRLAGLRIGGQWRLLPELDLVATVGGALTRYAQTNTLFLDKRHDVLWDASIGAQWRMSDALSLRPQLAYMRSDSNIGAYDSSRHDYSLTLRYDFR